MTVTRSAPAGACDRLGPRSAIEARCNAVGAKWFRPRPIGIAGAGSIGCFVGGMLAAGGRHVALLARPRVIAEIDAQRTAADEF